MIPMSIKVLLPNWKNRFERAPASDLFACLCLSLMVLWFNDDLIRGGKVPFFRDLGPYFYPMRFHLSQSFQAGELPLWNRHVSMGYPFLANPQVGVFYPPHLLFFVLSFFDAVRFLFVFHYGVAALGSYLLCRRWGYSPYLALIGSILFSFGGIIVSLSNLLDHFQTAVWLPWAVLLWERLLASGARRDFFVFVLALLIQLLAGSPEVYSMGMALLLMDGLRLKAQEGHVTYRRLFVSFLGANGLVAGLAMVQIAPTYELFLQSWRSQAIPYDKVAAWSMQPLRLINFFFLDKEVDPEAYNGLRFFFSSEPPLIISLYMGAISLFGLCLWPRGGSLKGKGILLGLILLALVFALGGYTPVHSTLYEHFLAFRWIRFPEKVLVLAHVLLLFAALGGLRSFLEERDRASTLPFMILSAVSILWLGLYIFSRFRTELIALFMARIAPGLPSDFDARNVSGVVFSAERQVILAAGILLLFFLFKRGNLGKNIFQLLLVGLVFFDLASAHRPYHLAVHPDTVLRPPAILSSPDAEPYRLVYFLDRSHLHPNTYAFTKRPFTSTVSSVFATLIPNAGVFYGFDYMQELEALGRKPYNLFLRVASGLPPERLYRLLAVLNVKYINTFGPLPDGDIHPIGDFPDYPSRLYRVDRPVPRTYIASKVKFEQEPQRILDQLSGPGFDPRRDVILDGPLSVPITGVTVARSEIVRYAPHQVTIRASLNGSGILVLADSFYPGWRATVDGREAEILRANFFLRGVSLGPGNHRVDFYYEPRSFTIGLGISLLTALGIIAGSAVLAYRRRRRG